MASSKPATTSPNPIRALYRTILGFINRIDSALGRRFYANDNPFSRHIRANRELRHIQSAANWQESDGNQAFKPEALEEMGYVRVNPLGDNTNTVGIITQKIGSALSNEENTVPRGSIAPDGKHYSRSLLNTGEHVPEIKHIITDDLLRSLECYYDSYVGVRNITCWRNFHIPQHYFDAQDHFGNRWHFDHRFWSLTHMFYAVDSIAEENGPFRIMSKSRTRWMLNNGFKGRHDYGLPSSTVEDPEHICALTGPAGSALVCKTVQCLHRASNPAPGHQRDILQFLFYPVTKPMPDNWFEQPSLFDLGLSAHDVR